MTSAAGGERPARSPASRQVIPRPPGAVAGGAPSWASLATESRRGLTLARVRGALATRHDALVGVERVVPAGAGTPGSPAAVLVALFEDDGEAHVVLTRRAAHLRTHTGEVAFPGGRLDPGETPEAGALREAGEEVGLDPHQVEVVGRLGALATFSSGTTITPVVGFLASRPRLVPNPTEVERVFAVPLAALAADGVFREERWPLSGRPRAVAPSPPGGHRAGHPAGDGPPVSPPVAPTADHEPDSFPVWFFELAEDTVWGATARILVDLLRLVLES